MLIHEWTKWFKQENTSVKGIIIDLVRLDDYMLYFIKKSYRHSSKIRLSIMAKTSNNQRLRSAADNDGRTKRFCSNAVLCVVSRYGWSKHARSNYEWGKVQTRMIKLRSMHFIHSLGSPNDMRRMRNNNLEIRLLLSPAKNNWKSHLWSTLRSTYRGLTLLFPWFKLPNKTFLLPHTLHKGNREYWVIKEPTRSVFYYVLFHLLRIVKGL